MEDHITPLKTGIKYGAIVGAVGILITLIMHYGGLNDYTDPMATSNLLSMGISFIIGLAITFLGIKYFKTNNEGLLTFGEGMSVALFIGLFAGILSAIFMYIFTAYIMTDLQDIMMTTIDTDEMSEQEAEISEQAISFAASPITQAFSSLLMSIFMGLVYGVISSLILKKE